MYSNDWKLAEQTVAAVFRTAAINTPDGIFCKSVDGGLSYAQAAGAIHALADELQPSVQGRVVALILPNSKTFMISYFASLFAGGTPALINHGHPQGTINTEAHGVKPGSAGKPVPDTTIEIVDLETGDNVLDSGQTGEIRVKGPHMMQCYTGNKAETDIAVRHGFVYTGDIGVIDEEGFLTITDRKKNVIFVSGFNVFPREIEEFLLTHPAISGACVVAAPHPRSGEVPMAFVTLRSAIDGEDIVAFCNKHFIKYKQPAQVIVLPEMPLSPAGKVDRIALGATIVDSAET